MNTKVSLLDFAKSKFLRSVFLRILIVFVTVIVLIIAIALFAFDSEINKSLILDRKKNLDSIEGFMSQRLSEMSSIAYSINNDSDFYMESFGDNSLVSYEMSKTLSRYLVGNDFVEHLAFNRVSEPDILYVSVGAISFYDFLVGTLGMPSRAAEHVINSVQSLTKLSLKSIVDEKSGTSYFSYGCPLPFLSKKPKAFVLMLVPFNKIEPIFNTQFSNCSGELHIFNSDGEEMFFIDKLDDDITKVKIDYFDNKAEDYFNYKGKKYIVQKKKSMQNSWTYVSIIRLNDITAHVAKKQLLFVTAVVFIMLASLFLMLYSIIKQYKPISELAKSFSNDKLEYMIDERSVLSNTLSTLKDESEQKQKFENAYNEATAANKAKSAFLSNISHDIRTPMNAIIGMTEIALNNISDEKHVDSCLKKIKVSSMYLLDILNNVLDMSRIESGKFTLTQDTIDLTKLVSGLIIILNHSIDVKSQQLIVNTNSVVNEKVTGDTVRLTQVLMNILSNAIKFTSHGGTIVFSIDQYESVKTGYADYVFRVKDNGIGISKEYLGHVFDTFSRDSSSDNKKIEGTGLGMAITKSLVELMGGTVTCESEIDKGTTFTVSITMKTEDENQCTLNKSKVAEFKNNNVLIIAKDEDSANKEIELFNECGVNTTYKETYENAKTCIDESIKNNSSFDYIVINQSEDDVSCENVVTSILNHNNNKDTVYVFVARKTDEIENYDNLKLCTSYVIQAPLFRSTVRKILNKSYNQQVSTKTSSIVSLENKRILLVEDNKMNREIAKALLSQTKAIIVEAVDGKEALNTFLNNPENYFDLILMDVQMPNMNGYEATLAIRSMQRSDAKTIPIIAMTANTFDEDVRQVKEAGMNGHLGKPYTSEELYKILEYIIKPRY